MTAMRPARNLLAVAITAIGLTATYALAAENQPGSKSQKAQNHPAKTTAVLGASGNTQGNANQNAARNTGGVQPNLTNKNPRANTPKGLHDYVELEVVPN